MYPALHSDAVSGGADWTDEFDFLRVPGRRSVALRRARRVRHFLPCFQTLARRALYPREVWNCGGSTAEAVGRLLGRKMAHPVIVPFDAWPPRPPCSEVFRRPGAVYAQTSGPIFFTRGVADYEGRAAGG